VPYTRLRHHDMAFAANEQELVRVINHVFLPPRLPQQEDESIDNITLNVTTDALTAIRTRFPHDVPLTAVDNAIDFCSRLQAVHSGPDARVSEIDLLHTLLNLQDGQMMAIKVTAQNAAVLITRERDQLVFEEFELSPKNEAIFSTKGRLIRTFPSQAWAVSTEWFQQVDFASTISRMLSTMSHQNAPGMQPQTKKAGANHDEDRDSTQPSIISELFFGIIRGIGATHSSSTVSKNMREEVLWKNARRPWRRSPMWLLIRVALQLVISRSENGSRTLYKKVMVFIMSQILDAARRFDLPAELIYVMNAKIDHRLQKLLATVSCEDMLVTSIRQVLRTSNKKISIHWAELQANDTRNNNIRALSALNFKDDIYVALRDLDSYIQAMKSRQSSDGIIDFEPTERLLKHDTDKPPPLPNGITDAYAVSNLQQFEQWVVRHLDQWTTTFRLNDACESLCSLIKSYHRLAYQLYADNPEGISIMLLTVLELWVACDRAAVSGCTLLEDYDPEIPSAVLENLLLPFLSQMQRLSKVELYLANRKNKSRSSRLFDASSHESFASRFYDKSETHQALHQRIILEADARKKQKLEELKNTQRNYRLLDELYNQTDHKYHEIITDTWCNPPEIQIEHDQACEKCGYERQRDSLRINVHEWPLPEAKDEVKAVVFELQVPPWFAHWRDARFYILHEVLKGKGNRDNICDGYKLSSNDPHLTCRYFRSLIHRIGLLSQDKPLVNTHYRGKDVSTCSQSTICVRNGLNYNYYDSTTRSYVDDFTFEYDVPLACTYKLPAETKVLERFLFRPANMPDGQAPNAVIAGQDACPESMALEEYKELCTLPLGHRIQWSNILLQLAVPSVDFKKQETTIFFLQCIYQAGPPSKNYDAMREAHRVIYDDSKARSVLENLGVALQRVKKNWESVQALNTFVMVATRVLTLNHSVKDDCLSFLKTCRDVAARWIEALRNKACMAEDHTEQTEFVSKSIEVALVCASTFNVDDKYLATILESTEDASLLVWASIVVQEGECTQGSMGPRVALLHLRFKRLLYRGYHLLKQNQAGLDAGIMKAWSAYVPSAAGWTQVSTAADHWITTTTDCAAGSAVRVHYDLLSGELLVKGFPLGQLPANYRVHPLFKKLFGNTAVEVMPATIPGFQFSTKRSFRGYNVQMVMHGEHLIVRATDPSATFETVPSRVVRPDYPQHFHDDYVHWYNARENIVEFRPIDDPWNPRSALKWTLSQTKTPRWKLTKDSACLLGIKSETSQALWHILQPLAHSSRIHCTFEPSESLLQVEIPSLRLGFSLAENSSTLQSREYRSMAVDQDQSLGTLIGFLNKLILKSQTSSSRIALILESELSYVKQHDHISIRVNHCSKSKVHALGVDTSLHRLLDSGDVDCKLYLAYLHALTSFCLPDPLTRRTGTEEALSILRSKSVASVHQLSQSNIDLLGKIACLSPGRTYYPSHLCVMQQVNWDERLGFLSQHGDFSVVASDIFQSKLANIFYPDIHFQVPYFKEIKDDLRERDKIRSSTFRVCGFGAEDCTTSYDKPYVARDQAYLEVRAQKVATMCGLVLRDHDAMHWKVPSHARLWALMQTQSLIHGTELDIKDSRLRYDADLLENGFEFATIRFPALHHLFKNQDSRQHIFAITTFLCTIAFADDADMEFLQILAMCFKSPHLAAVDAPSVESFTPKDGLISESQKLRDIILENSRAYHACPEYSWPRHPDERRNEYSERRHNEWQRSRNAVVTQMVDSLMSQWPCEVPVSPIVANASTYIDINRTMTEVSAIFQTWYNNTLLYKYLFNVQQAMERLSEQAIDLPALNLQYTTRPTSIPGFVSEVDLFSQPAPALPQNCHIFELSSPRAGKSTCSTAEPALKSFVQKLRSVANQSPYETEYSQALEESLHALISRSDANSLFAHISHDELMTYLGYCKAHADRVYEILIEALCSPPRSEGAREVQRLPRLSPTFLLKQLARDRWPYLSEGWQICIVEYGLALTAFQRAERMVKLADPSRKEELMNEVRNAGHVNWDPFEYPESLLIEVESGIMIREIQENIAGEMRRPSSNTNAVMQLNMGEGKSSVIVPIVAAALANGSQLVKVIVGKPQSRQMQQMLISKLGGLVDRRVYHMPVTRALRLTRMDAEAISHMVHQCLSTGGILLVQPEHILSFRLMALECYINGKSDVGESLMATQDFLDRYSRDIVDESDENFSTRFELIYTMGMQRSIELSPDRWLLLQQVLELARRYVPGLAQKLPASIEVAPGVAGSFQRFRILRKDAEELLLTQIAEHICQNGLDMFYIGRQSSEVRNAVYAYITKYQPSDEEIQAVEAGPMWTDTTRSHVLILRGLLAEGVLAFALSQKRWRVNYGLATRVPPTKLAVPYRAKDSPALRSEFSHPDVVITLTSLCYYYVGLDDEDLFTAFRHVMNSDQADVEYQRWVKDSHALSSGFHQLQGINLRDRLQCINELFPSLRHGKAVIDYFLSHIVFPKEMKEYPHKLSASGWDIGKPRERLTTGFSGTMDSQWLLPLGVEYLDLPEQKHTNALVLKYLLQPENGVHLLSPAAGATSDADHLLTCIMRLEPDVQVILDVGAQILELKNLEVAMAWLKLHGSSKEAVLFVDDDDEICVVDRKGQADRLQQSSYKSRLDSCLVFLDESHTRGTDLQLPTTYRAAVTLGANMTKDRLVQACMRMRKLGKGQTVVFCIPEEIQTKILDTTSKDGAAAIEVEDVLRWAIAETYADIRRNMPLWAVQGKRFVQQEELWKAAQRSGETILTKDEAAKFLEDEAQSIAGRYRPRQTRNDLFHLSDITNVSLERIATRCRKFNDLPFGSSALQEEQERELSPEVEQERQVQRAPPATPAMHNLHPDVERFIMTGEIIVGSTAYGPGFSTLTETNTWKSFQISWLRGGQHLLATADFSKTVERVGASFELDNFLRPVQWIVSNCAKGSDTVERIMIISPYEANQLCGRMESSVTTLHLYKPRVNSGYASLDALVFHTIPARSTSPSVPRFLAVQLNVFSGQLYINSYEDYLETCQFLGLSPRTLTKEMEEQGWKVDADGFILCDDQGRIGGDSKLKESPVSFLKALTSIRRNGDSIAKTHVGGLLKGKIFQLSDFEA